MATIGAMLRNFERLDTDKVILESLTDTQIEFVQENRDQMNEGFTKIPGIKIGDTDSPVTGRSNRYKSNKYARVKNSMNSKPGLGNPDLRVTGRFQNAIRTKITQNEIEEYSEDGKAEALEAKYPEIYGLGGKHKAEYLNDHLGPTIRKKITTVTGLKFK